MRKAIEEALAKWRAAILRRDAATDGDREALNAEAKRAGAEFQRLSAEHMAQQIDALQEAEARRKRAVTSTAPFHEAARDEKQIASEIWDTARVSDEETSAPELSAPSVAQAACSGSSRSIVSAYPPPPRTAMKTTINSKEPKRITIK